MSTSLTTEDPKLLTIKQVLHGSRKKIEHALPSHISADRMIRVTLNALQGDAKLLDCTPLSVYQSVIEASTYGWEIGGPVAEAYLIPFRDNKAREMRAQLIPGYRGLLNLARNSGEVSTILRGVVREGDHFIYSMTAEPPILHQPKTDAGRKDRPIECVWVLAKMKDGGYQPMVMSYEEIIDHRNKFSKGYDRADSPWKLHEEIMCEKTVLRRFLLHGHVPMSAEMRQLALRTEEPITTDVVSSQVDRDEPIPLPLGQPTAIEDTREPGDEPDGELFEKTQDATEV